MLVKHRESSTWDLLSVLLAEFQEPRVIVEVEQVVERIISQNKVKKLKNHLTIKVKKKSWKPASSGSR